ncbi:MAG: peptidylprolyl isomerase [bacterium]
MNWKKSLFIMMVLSLFTVGCTGAQKGEKSAKGDDKVVATVNETEITAGDIESLLEQLHPMQRQQYLTDEGKKQLIDQVVETFLIADKAKGEGLNKEPEFLAQMKFAESQILAQKYVKKKIEDIKVTDADAKKYYDENLGKYSSGQVKASHILVNTEEEAKAIYEELQKAPKKFEEIAKARSKDPGSGANGGDLGWFGRDRMVKPFEDAAFSMKKGEISKPVKTQFGFHIIRLDDKTEITQKSFEEVQEEIKSALTQEKQQNLIKDLLEELKKEGKIKINDEELKDVGKEYKVPLPPAHPDTGGK